MPNANGLPTHDELRSLSETDLVRSIDRQYSMTPNERHLLIAQLFRDELARRQQEKSTAAIHRRGSRSYTPNAQPHLDNPRSDNSGTRRFGCCASRCTSIRVD